MKARLVSYKAEKPDLAFPVPANRTTIGREADNFVQLPDPNVSKHHAAIVAAQGRWTIEDLDSRNGTFVNGAAVKRCELKNGDRVRIGSAEFVFETVADDQQWVPSHVIDMSASVRDETMLKQAALGRDKGKG